MNERQFKNLDFNLLKVFLILYEVSSPSRAANILGITQPAVSHALKRLRISFDDELFTRAPGGMIPTSYAEDIYPEIEKIFDDLRSALVKTDSFNPNIERKTFKVMMSDSSQIFFSPILLKISESFDFKIKFDMIEFKFNEARSVFINNLADIALGNIPEIADLCEIYHLMNDRIVYILSSNHIFNKKYFVKSKQNPPSILEIYNEFKDFDFNTSPCVEVNNFIQIPHIVSRTNLISIYPESIAKILNSENNIKFETGVFSLKKMPVNMYIKNNKKNYSSIFWLISEIKKYLDL